MDVKAQAIANLRAWDIAAREAALDYCLMDGTLLGAVRDGDFCPGDEDDLDIGVLDKDYDQVDVVLARLTPLGFQKYKPLMFKGRLEGFGFKRGSSHFDIIRINHHPTREECYNIGRRRGELLAFVYPAEHHARFEEIEFYELRVKVPANPEGFLTARYGDWRTPIPRPGFRWYDQSNRESIQEDYDILK